MNRYQSKLSANSNDVCLLGWCPCKGSCSLTCSKACKYNCGGGCKGTCLNDNMYFW